MTIAVNRQRTVTFRKICLTHTTMFSGKKQGLFHYYYFYWQIWSIWNSECYDLVLSSEFVRLYYWGRAWHNWPIYQKTVLNDLRQIKIRLSGVTYQAVWVRLWSSEAFLPPRLCIFTILGQIFCVSATLMTCLCKSLLNQIKGKLVFPEASCHWNIDVLEV